MSNNNEDNVARNLLPLEPKEKKYASDKVGKFKVQTDPVDASSVKYDFLVNHVEGNEDLRELLRFYSQAMKLAKALNIGDDTAGTNGASLDKIVLSLLHTSVKNLYESGRNAARTAAKDTLIKAALAALPDGATENAKRAARDAVAEPNYTVVIEQYNAIWSMIAELPRAANGESFWQEVE